VPTDTGLFNSVKVGSRLPVVNLTVTWAGVADSKASLSLATTVNAFNTMPVVDGVAAVVLLFGTAGVQ